MGNTCNENECCDEKQTCSTGCEMTDMLMGLADKAWEQLMVEKMKAIWQKTRGPNMDKVAKAGVEASMAKWMHMMKGKEDMHKAMEGIRKSFS